MVRQGRRKFLRGVGVSLALPMLESFLPAGAQGATTTANARRLVCVGTYLGFHQSDFFPARTGKNYEISPVLKPLEAFRDEMTVFSGLDHRGRNGHKGWQAWMTGSAYGSVSMDQVVAEKVGEQTRFDSLQVTCGNPPAEARISFTKEGVALPMIGRPSVLYRSLFRSAADNARTDYLLAGHGSVLDGVVEEARDLERHASVADREKLAEYFASVRDVEKRI